MNKYIDAEWLKQNFNTVFWSQITKTIDSAPSIDIVFCKECKYWHKNRKEGDGMNVFDVCYDFQADDFCSYGEREGE